MNVIVFNGDCGVAVMFPAENTGMTIEEIAEKDTPAGSKYIITDYSSLPADFPQSSWSIDFKAGEVLVDSEKLKSIYIADAGLEKDRLIVEANVYINDHNWPSKLALGRLSDDDKARFNAWLDYIEAVTAVDTATAPDINWPDKPLS
ncbi:tail fiber assembly protein [Mixta calida]|uniref:tail fiber assembly protein n=1 Tax=Mixta calida TaxID=665913 RepID=UPI00290F71B9|nr:tail fiber assembly protein [Mixta calida]MDU6539174.1 tail fiber assembly protein [Mixta calida]